MANWEQVSWAPPADAMRAIRIGAVYDYLAQHGWVEKASNRPWFRYYEHGKRRLDDGRPVHYYFPALTDDDKAGIDYPLSILQFIEAQARYQQAHPYDIFNELKAATPAGAAVQSAAG